MSVGIYKITNIINHKSYIGIDSNIDKSTRIKQHMYDLVNNRHFNKHLQISFNKYGKEAFKYEIVFETTKNNKSYLEKLEIFFIRFFNTYKNGYNGTTGGYGHYKNNLLYKKAFVLDLKTNKITEGYSLKTLCKDINVPYSSVKWSLENKKAYKNKLLFSYSPNFNIEEYGFIKPGMTPLEKKLSRRVKVKKDIYTMRKIYQFDLEGNFIKEWKSISEAARFVNTTNSNIIRAAKGNSVHCKNYKWSYDRDNIPTCDKKPVYYKKTN